IKLIGNGDESIPPIKRACKACFMLSKLNHRLRKIGDIVVHGKEAPHVPIAGKRKVEWNGRDFVVAFLPHQIRRHDDAVALDKASKKRKAIPNTVLIPAIRQCNSTLLIVPQFNRAAKHVAYSWVTLHQANIALKHVRTAQRIVDRKQPDVFAARDRYAFVEVANMADVFFVSDVPYSKV